MIPAGSIRQAREATKQIEPRAIVVDILLRGEDAWKWLAELKTDTATRHIPVLVATTVEDERKGYALGVDEYCVKPVKRETLLHSLERLTGASFAIENQKTAGGQGHLQQALIIDDEAASRYILAKLMKDQPFLLHQAANGTDGLHMAKEIAPGFIFLDLDMPDLSGFDVLDRLKSDPEMRAIPVAVVTSLILNEAERQRLEPQVCAILSKSELSRERIEQLLTTIMTESPDRRGAAHH
jgi:CheY-like chemotaxis protein